MYIRRKVFSVAYDENGEERLFSTTEFVNEDTYLDQREYSENVFGKNGEFLGTIREGKFLPAKENETSKLISDIYDKSTGKFSKKSGAEYASAGGGDKAKTVVKKLTDKEIKALNKTQKAGQKAYKAGIKETKKSQEFVDKLAKKKASLLERKEMRDFYTKQARKGRLTGKNAALLAAGGLALGAGAGYAATKLGGKNKKAALEAKD